MSPDEVKQYYGSLYRFGKETGMSPGSLLNWLSWGRIPLASQEKLENITKGKLVASFNRVNPNDKGE